MISDIKRNEYVEQIPNRTFGIHHKINENRNRIHSTSQICVSNFLAIV